MNFILSIDKLRSKMNFVLSKDKLNSKMNFILAKKKLLDKITNQYLLYKYMHFQLLATICFVICLNFV